MKKHWVVWAFILVLMISGCMGGTKTGNGSISGFVYIQNQTDHSGVNVLLEERNKTVTTTALGEYSFTGLPDGTYTLHFSKEGYQTIEEEVQIINENETELEPVNLLVEVLPFSNPILATIYEHGTYFDFDSGQQTNDWTKGDMRLNAFTIYQTEHLMHIDEVMGQLFPEPWPNNTLSFNQFRDVQLEDVQFPTEKQIFQSPWIGDVIVLKTDQNKIVKLIIIDKISDDSDDRAPTFTFLYLYDNFEDTTIPLVEEIILVTEDGNEYSTVPDGGEIVYNVSSRPLELKYVFNEYVKAHYLSYNINGSSLLSFQPEDLNMLYYDILITNLIGIESGENVIEFPDTDAYYVEDLSGNQITTKFFSKMTINYIEE